MPSGFDCVTRGKVFVFSGILPICADEDGLAAVLGHEIAHNVAHHQAESMSKQAWAVGLFWAVSIFLGGFDVLTQLLLDLGYMRPGSRKQEVIPLLIRCVYLLFADSRQAEVSRAQLVQSKHVTKR